MITSCQDCKTNCCKIGPGPYRKLSPVDYLENFGTISAYNTKCTALKDDGTCNLWGTSKFPDECRTYVCQVRSFTKNELAAIRKVDWKPTMEPGADRYKKCEVRRGQGNDNEVLKETRRRDVAPYAGDDGPIPI